VNAIGYVRISTKDQSQYSLDYQERLVKQYCSTNNLQLLAIFKDDGESSYTFDRPDWLQLEAFIKKTKNVQYLIIFDHDRFSRNLAEALIKIKELHDKFGIKVLATTDNFNTDFSDPSTFMLRAFKYLLAENELHRIRQRTKTGLLQAALQGRHPNRAPYGYSNTRDGQGKPIIVIDEEQAAHVRSIFREYIRGNSVEEVRRIVKAQGYKGKGNSAIQRVLSNPVYCGKVKAAGKLIDGLHDPIISDSDYWLVQKKLHQKTIVTQNREEVPLRGVLRSAFGELLTAGNSRGKAGRYYWYYVDKRNKLNFPADRLHRQFSELLKNMSLGEREAEETKEILLSFVETWETERGSEIKKLKADLQRLQQRIDTVERKYLYGESVTEATYKQVIGDLRADEATLRRKIAEYGTSGEAMYNQVYAVVPKLTDLYSHYEMMDLNDKHEFINVVFDRRLYYADQSYRTPFLHYAFKHKEMILKEKRLLLIEQPVIKLGSIPNRSGIGNPVELNDELFTLLARVV